MVAHDELLVVLFVDHIPRCHLDCRTANRVHERLMQVLLGAEQWDGGGELNVTVETTGLIEGGGLEVLGCLRCALWQDNGNFQLAVGNGFLGAFKERNL